MTKLPQDVYEVVRCQQQIKDMLTMLVQSKGAPNQESETVYLALPVEKWEELVELQKELSNITLASRTQEQYTNAAFQQIEEGVKEGGVKKEEQSNDSEEKKQEEDDIKKKGTIEKEKQERIHLCEWECQKGHEYALDANEARLDRNDFVCRYEGCGKVCKSKAGLTNHQKACKYRVAEE
ncbi:uncharacterized protein LOC108677292 isoform X2 [Hyalella azteca]|nr:uncharacterized protein LOC108677292 isoform X2 [Hyalella azteca]XP_047741186.1 uncharacterized protein LOC108677292 isoform X2 [Hyalella azteca]